MPNQYSNLPSLTGQVFGKWTVGEEVKEKTQTSYLCTCECGNVQKVRRGRLVSGNSKKCLNCRSVKGVCKRGHPIELAGRTKNGICRMCAKENNVFYKYGITMKEYVALYNFQGGKCAICGRTLALIKKQDKLNPEGRAEVDHLHILKKQKIKPPKKDTVRGLLCGGRWAGCNHKLGRVDKIEWLRAALAYLENPPAHQLFRKAL